MLPRRLLRWATLVGFLALLTIFTCLCTYFLDAVQKPELERTQGNAQNGMRISVPIFVNCPQNLLNYIKRRVVLDFTKSFKVRNARPDCRSAIYPILLLLDMDIEKILHPKLRYLDPCSHHCCFTFYWDEFIDEADLVAVPTFRLPFISPVWYNKSV